MPFDATVFSDTGAQIFTGIAVSNMDTANSAKIVCTAKNDTGTVIANAVNVPVLAPFGHWAAYNFPALLGKRGLLDCTGTTTIAAIGLRFLGSNAFSSLTVDLSVATKKCAILVGRRRQWSGYGVAGGWHKNVTVDSGRIVL